MHRRQWWLSWRNAALMNEIGIRPGYQVSESFPTIMLVIFKLIYNSRHVGNFSRYTGSCKSRLHFRQTDWACASAYIIIIIGMWMCRVVEYMNWDWLMMRQNQDSVVPKMQMCRLHQLSMIIVRRADSFIKCSVVVLWFDKFQLVILRRTHK